MKTTTVTVGDVKFYIRPFDAFDQLEMFGDLQREVLPSIGAVLNVAFDKNAAAENSDTATIAALRDLSTQFDGATLRKWAARLLHPEYVSYEARGDHEPSKLTQDHVGSALPDFAYVLELMYHVGKVNFAVPLGRWAALSGLAQKAREKLSGASATTS